MAQELFARLPAATQAQYGSPEKLIALMLAKDASSLTGMQILGQRDVSPDVVGVRVRSRMTRARPRKPVSDFARRRTGCG